MKVRMVACCALLAALVCLSPGAHAGPPDAPTAENWLHHPDIVRIRAVYREVREALERDALRESQRTFEYCEPYEDMTRIIHADETGTVRHYFNEGGSDDSAVDRDFYYDGKGTLRFVFIRGGAVNDTRIEHRIYFDQAGERLWEIQKLLEGPGYTFPRTWPDEDLVRNPAEEYRSPNPCPEKESSQHHAGTAEG